MRQSPGQTSRRRGALLTVRQDDELAAARAAAWAAAKAAAKAAAWGATRDAAGDAARDAEHDWQAERLRQYLIGEVTR